MVENNSTPAVQEEGHSFLSEFNLPKLLLGRAGEVISRLIGEGGDIPVAYLEQYSQRIRDKTSGNSAISQALATKVAERAVDDPKLVERAMASFSNDLLRKQGNREQVAAKALEELSGSEINEKPKKIDDDWMNAFADLSENASSALMQERWAKILAGEIISPGHFSKKTLQIVDVLPRDVANRFEEYARSLVGGRLISSPSGELTGQEFVDIEDFADFGLIRSTHAYSTFLFRDAHFGSLYTSIVELSGRDIFLFKRKPSEIKISGYFLTPSGKQIAKLLGPTKSLDTDLVKRILEVTDVNYAIDISELNSIPLEEDKIMSHKNLVYSR